MEFAGELGLGSLSNDCIEVNIADTSYVGLHLFCRMSKHIPPSAYTLGWNILDTNRTVGGLFGYSSVNSIVSLNVPSSNGVSWGPNITAFQIMILLSVGAPDTPVGGSSCKKALLFSWKTLQHNQGHEITYWVSCKNLTGSIILGQPKRFI